MPEGCADNPDGTKYGDHCIATHDWDTIREMTGALWHVAQVVSILQGENYVTSSLVYPMLGTLLDQLADDEPIILQDERGDTTLYVVEPSLIDPDIKVARFNLREELIRRFYTIVDPSDMEDVGIASLLDPRCVPLICI